MSKKSYLLKNIGILSISNFASKILVFFLVPLYTSVLSTEEYGVYDLVNTTLQLLLPVLTLNIVDAVMRFSMDATEIKDKNDIVSIAVKHLTISFIILGAALFCASVIFHVSSIEGIELYIFLMYLFYALDQFVLQLAKGFDRVADLGAAGVIGTAALIGGNVLFLLCFEWGLNGFFAANILSYAIPTLYLTLRLKIWKYVKLDFDKALYKEMLRYCAPLLFVSVSWWINSAADKYTVAFLLGTASTGIISVAYKIPNILNALQSIFIQAWQISAIREVGSKDSTDFYAKTFSYLNVLMALATSTIIILSRPLASFLYAKDFYTAWQYVPFLLIAGVLNTASGFYGSILSALKDSASMTKSAVVGAFANIVLNFLLIYMWGIQGAAIATAIGSFVIFYVRKTAVKGRVDISNYWKIYTTWLLLCVQSCVEIFSLSYVIEGLILAILIILNLRELKMFSRDILSTLKQVNK